MKLLSFGLPDGFLPHLQKLERLLSQKSFPHLTQFVSRVLTVDPTVTLIAPTAPEPH
jgi:hypothetical protein